MQSPAATTDPTVIDTGSLVQPHREFNLSDIANELPGYLEVPERPKLSAGYADIYHGVWTSPQGERIEVAIKELKDLIPPNMHTDPEALMRRTDTRMRREAYVWSQINHRNLHPLLGYRSQPKPRLVSRWCNHGNLMDYLRRNPDLPRLHKLWLVYQTALGLDHLHSQTPPICHADIKPENVLITDYFEATLSDFGLSRVLQALSGPTGFTTSETPKGTYNYMAFEILNEGLQPNCKTDVYAFGGLILAVMSGNPPFFGLRGTQIMRRAVQYQPPSPDDHPNLPPSDPLWTLMRHCWDKSPAARPTIREVLWELWNCICREQSTLLSIPSLPPVSEDTDSECSDMDLDTPGGPSQGGILAFQLPNVVPADDPPPRATDAAETSSSIPMGALVAAWDAFESIQVKCKAVPVIGSYIGAVAGLGSSLVRVVQAMDKSEDMTSDLESNTWKLASLLEVLVKRSNGRRGDEIAPCISDIRRELQCAQDLIKKWSSSDHFENALSSGGSAEGLKKCQRTICKVLEEIELLVSLTTARLVTEFETPEIHKEHRRLLNLLGDGSYGARGSSTEDVICLPDTRVDILESIDNWVRDKSTSERVLWIRGMAGRGKSTIASTVAHSWMYRASCAIFHFRRGQNMMDSRIICALARQLGKSLVAEVRDAVMDCLMENEDIAKDRLDEQFKTLIVGSLGELQHQIHPILIIVDALDECENIPDAVRFVKLIDKHSSSLPTNIKFLLTCRPEAPLLVALEPRRWHMEDLDSRLDVLNDISRFIQHACKQIRDDHDLSEDWPSPGDVERFVEMSQGLFQWARTAMTYICDGSPDHRLRELLQRPSAWIGLDDLYHQVLSKAFNKLKRDPMRQQLLSWVLGTLVVAPYPVSLEALAYLCADHEMLKDQDNVIQLIRKDILVDLSSLILVPTSPHEPIRLMHTSIHDLLTHRQRCEEQQYFVDPAQNHQRLASASLRIMECDLRQNICNLSDLSEANADIQDIVQSHVSTGLRYCCRSWSIHLTEGIPPSGPKVDTLIGILAVFKSVSEQKLMYWLEVMSLIGAIAEAFKAAVQVHKWLLQSPEETFDSELATLWSDIQRFIAAFAEPISFSALHIYSSALPHCPAATKLRQRYISQATGHILHGKRKNAWDAHIWTSTAGSGIHKIAFSPDGKVVASGASDGTIRFWDAQTGMSLGDPLSGHSEPVNTIAFSSNGKVVASGSRDGAIRLWDTRTRMSSGDALSNHTLRIGNTIFSPNDNVVAPGAGDGTIQYTRIGMPSDHFNRPFMLGSSVLSPDGKVQACGFRDGRVQFRDTQTGRLWDHSLPDDSQAVNTIVFSSNGNVVNSGASDRTIRLRVTWTGISWDDHHSSPSKAVNTITFSPNGNVVNSGASDGTIRLWDTWTRILWDDDHSSTGKAVNTITFSPDGKVVASGSNNGTIRFWNTQSRMPLGDPLSGHSEAVNTVAFSPDGKVVASGSNDGTIRFWNTQSGMSLGDPLSGHSKAVSTIAFSPDGKVVASGSRDGAIRLWDTRAGMSSGDPLSDHTLRIDNIVFSPDGKVLASRASDRTIRLWDTRTGMSFGDPLSGHSKPVNAIAFSPDGKVMASGSYDKTIRLWDTRNGMSLVDPISSHTWRINTIGFSPDGKVVASGACDGMIRLWDARTGMSLGDPLSSHSEAINTIIFSPDGKAMASGSRDGTIRLWDTRTGMSSPLSGHTWSINTIAFSPNGKVVASGARDGTIRLWHTQTGMSLGNPLSGHSKAVNTIAFSPDSKALASGYDDGTIQLWETQTGMLLGDPNSITSRSKSVSGSMGGVIGRGDDITCQIWNALPNYLVTSYASIKLGWVVLGGKRVLWLPHEYWGGRFSLIHSCGRIALYSETILFILDLSRSLGM